MKPWILWVAVIGLLVALLFSVVGMLRSNSELTAARHARTPEQMILDYPMLLGRGGEREVAIPWEELAQPNTSVRIVPHPVPFTDEVVPVGSMRLDGLTIESYVGVWSPLSDLPGRSHWLEMNEDGTAWINRPPLIPVSYMVLRQDDEVIGIRGLSVDEHGHWIVWTGFSVDF